ncbi:MAG: hypothetical protein WC369_09095 [Dehalococcoidales bacterium]|jgi:hypothetical protein
MRQEIDASSPIDNMLAGDAEVVCNFEREIRVSGHWYLALLKAIGLWTTAEETYQGRCYHYLIGGEAFDWLLLAERLCLSMEGLAPDDEVKRLLFNGYTPIDLTLDEFRNLIGDCKYHQYLNFFYGITVEEALIATIRGEVRKERRGLGLNHEGNTTDAIYQRIYGADRQYLLNLFRREKSYRPLKSITLDELKEFTYWLFKRRIRICDKARVASDTRKGLEWLKGKIPLSQGHYLSHHLR